MTTSYQTLEAYNGVQVAIAFVIEGFDKIFATQALPDTFTADSAPYSSFSDPIGGLKLKGSLTGSIKLYAQDLQPETLEVNITDPDGQLAPLLREAYSAGHKTYLTQSIDAGSTSTIHVQSTTGFTSPIYIGGEAIGFSGSTATTFTGITRGLYTINQTDSGAAFAPAHTIGENVTVGATTAPAVTDYPKTWFGRFVHLMLFTRDPLTGAWNLPSTATKLWSGRMQGYGDNDADGSYTITCKSAIDLLYKPVGMAQWMAHANEGLRFSGTNGNTIAIQNTAGAGYDLIEQLTDLNDGVPKAHDEIASIIQAQFDTWRSAGDTSSGDLWDIQLYDTGNGGPPHYDITLNANTTSIPLGETVKIGMYLTMWAMLGWETDGTGEMSSTGDRIIWHTLQRQSDSLWHLAAPRPPIISFGFTRIPNTTVDLSDEVGTFYTQDAALMRGAPPEANGVVAVSSGTLEGIFAVDYEGGTPATIRLVAELDSSTGMFVPLEYGNPSGISASDNQFDGAFRLGQLAEPPGMKQVWFETGPAGTLLLKALLSTGANTYNHTTYDVYDWGGVGVPTSLVDVHSWLDLNEAHIQLLITEPKPFFEFLEPILNATNRYLVWKAASASLNPKMCVIRPTLDTSEQGGDSGEAVGWQLTESNKTESPGRMRVTRGVDGIINRVVIKYGNVQQEDDTQAKQVIVEDIASQTDYGRRRTVTIEAPMVTNLTDVAVSAIGPALAYCARPLAIARRTYNASLIRMAPGDAVTVTDNYMVDPTTGTRGAVLYGWVLNCSFDLATGKGQVEIVFLPEKVPRVAIWAPSASVAISGGLSQYDAGTKTLTVEQSRFAAPFGKRDAQWFVVGDKVHIYSLDEASPLEWHDTIASLSTTTIQVTTGLAGFDTSKQYVVEYDAITTAVTSQQSRAYIADDADLSTGGAISTPFDWGVDGSTVVLGPLGTVLTPVYTHGMFEPPTAGYAEKGQPASVHKAIMAAQGANALLAYKTRTVLINSFLQNAATVTGTTRTLVFLAWCPLYGHIGLSGNRGLKWRLHGKCSSAGALASFVISSSPKMPVGATFAGVTFPLGSTSATYQTNATTFTWSTESALACSPSAAVSGSRELWGTWITIEAFTDTGGVTATLDGIFVCEEELT